MWRLRDSFRTESTKYYCGRHAKRVKTPNGEAPRTLKETKRLPGTLPGQIPATRVDGLWRNQRSAPSSMGYSILKAILESREIVVGEALGERCGVS